ncbi:MAG: hypothetical protein AAFX45_01580 [Pseudomonadota bacterium]
MNFLKLVLPLVAICIGLVVWDETRSPPKSANLPANAPAPDSETPGIGNLVSALGIALGTGGGMNTIGGSGDARLITDPNRTRRNAFYGWDVEHPGLAGPGESIHLVQSAMAGVPMRPEPEYPAAVVATQTADGCIPPAVATGQKLAKVQIFEAEMPSGYHAVSDRDLADGAAKYLRDLQQTRDPAKERPSGQTRPAPVVNVVITDDSAPLYLVLQAATRPVVWNLHAAPTVKVEQIVLIGNPGQAVHPLSPDTPITMLAIGPDCAPQPWPDTTGYWEVYTSPGIDSGDYREQSAERYARYNDWFASAFGEAAHPGTSGAWISAHMLVGPLPAAAETRPQYRPLTGATIVAHEGPLLYVSPRLERQADIAARRHALAVAAAGGDLSVVNPTPMERTQ